MQTKINVDRLISRRKELGLTQTEAAKLIGVSQPAYQRYEAGTRIPSIQVVKAIANAFNVSVSYLTGEGNQISPDFLTIDKNATPLLFSIVEQFKNCDEKTLNKLLDYYRSIQ